MKSSRIAWPRGIGEAVEHRVFFQALHNAGWKEHGRLLWLWVFTCASATLFIVGQRSREVLRTVLGAAFGGWLMSDGYWAYREIDWRLRCLAHVVSKAHGLEESLDRQAQRFGRHLLAVIATVIEAVYQARGGAPPDAGLRALRAAARGAVRAVSAPRR